MKEWHREKRKRQNQRVREEEKGNIKALVSLDKVITENKLRIFRRLFVRRSRDSTVYL